MGKPMEEEDKKVLGDGMECREVMVLEAEVQKSNTGYFSREMRGEQHQWGEQKAKTPVSASCEEPRDGPRKEDTLRSEKQVLILGTSETGLKLLDSLLPP